MLTRAVQGKWNSLYHLCKKPLWKLVLGLTEKASLTRYLGSGINEQAFLNCSLPFKGIFKKKKNYPLNLQLKKIPREPFQLI